MILVLTKFRVNMTNKISIRSVQLEWLDSRCLMEISKYARRRFDVDTVIMDLRDPEILQQVFDHAHVSSGRTVTGYLSSTQTSY